MPQETSRREHPDHGRWSRVRPSGRITVDGRRGHRPARSLPLAPGARAPGRRRRGDKSRGARAPRRRGVADEPGLPLPGGRPPGHGPRYLCPAARALLRRGRCPRRGAGCPHTCGRDPPGVHRPARAVPAQPVPPRRLLLLHAAPARRSRSSASFSPSGSTRGSTSDQAGPVGAFVEEEVDRWLCDLVGYGAGELGRPDVRRHDGEPDGAHGGPRRAPRAAPRRRSGRAARGRCTGSCPARRAWRGRLPSRAARDGARWRPRLCERPGALLDRQGARRPRLPGGDSARRAVRRAVPPPRRGRRPGDRRRRRQGPAAACDRRRRREHEHGVRGPDGRARRRGGGARTLAPRGRRLRWRRPALRA